MKTQERVHFRLIHAPCCGTLLCWVNPRLPNFCPECGEQLYRKLKFDAPERILIADENAWIKYDALEAYRDELQNTVDNLDGSVDFPGMFG